MRSRFLALLAPPSRPHILDRSSLVQLTRSRPAGHEGKPFAVSWNTRDLLLYAVGVRPPSSSCSSSSLSELTLALQIGAKVDELAFTYEDDPKFHPFPTYPLVLGLKGDGLSTVNFAQAKDRSGPTPGLPALDPKRVVHAEQSIEILGELPSDSGKGWTLKDRCVGVKDTGFVSSLALSPPLSCALRALLALEQTLSECSRPLALAPTLPRDTAHGPRTSC